VSVSDGAPPTADRPLGPIGHVHALTAPAWLGGDVLVGTHQGVLRWSNARGWSAVGAATHDLMGLTADPERSGVLYASGHPDLRTDLANPLGLVVSEDGGRSWSARSLAGSADFHAMAAGADALWAWNALRSETVRSFDGGRTWEAGDDGTLAPAGPVLALSADGAAGNGVLAATARGVWHTEGDGAWRPIAFGDSPVTAVHAGHDAIWVYVAGDGPGLVRSDDRGATWRSVPVGLGLGAAVIAIVATHEDPTRVFAATANGDLLHTVDGGATWNASMTAGAPH